MRVTKRSNIAMRVLMFCAANSDRLVTKAEIARATNASENHLAQVINQLAQLGYLHTQRGRNGGLELARAPDQIVIGEIFRTIESRIPMTECFGDVDNTCPLSDCCRLRDALNDAAEAFFKTLDPLTLDTLTCDNEPLMALLGTTGRCRTAESAVARRAAVH
ncbi:Rrf2 family transcriptional regulator [Thalassococcus sp. CAU 1522]|uniref:Rrf2 family transcriptional regulator n=1 Tax=Thalassococcus arenae TaxID=2851652 RepID=A0ABS6N5K9_9RHOB|nr:Rrf2 family transcriptional regulator [Thalassococcus arenae]